MRLLIYCIIFTLIGTSALGQDQKGLCNCPNDFYAELKSADIYFSFNSGDMIGICGDFYKDSQDTIVSDFVLFQCGQGKIFGEWDATETCRIAQLSDTIFVQRYYGLAIGEELQLKWVPFFVDKYYYKDSVLQHAASFMTGDISKYTSKQISFVIDDYERMSILTSFDTLLLAGHRLFWAYVSGSSKAEELMNGFYEKFGPFDGAVAEEFSDLWATYLLFKD